MSDHPIPVILDTDIGGDIDDTWALAMLLKDPALDVKLVVSDMGETTYRARLIAKYLQTVGRSDIPVGVGLPTPSKRPQRQAAWIEGYTLADYPGTVQEDGVQAIIDTIRSSDEPVTLICIGPVPNIKAALDRDPAIAENARFVGMHGSVFVGYGGSPERSPECNVVLDPAACRSAFEAPWIEKIITPLDSCERVTLDGARYRRIRESDGPALVALMENYAHWLAFHGKPAGTIEEKSSILFDTVAVHLAASTRYLTIQPVGLRVTDDGYTVPDEAGAVLRVATGWSDLEGYKDALVERLLSPTVRPGGKHA